MMLSAVKLESHYIIIAGTSSNTGAVSKVVEVCGVGFHSSFRSLVVVVCTTDDAGVHVRVFLETSEKIKKQVVVIGQDLDLLVLPTALTPDYMDILMLKEGKGKVKDRFYSSKDLQNSNLVIECKKSILFLHAISGCDTTSGFYGKGKLQAVQLFNHSKYLKDIPEMFNNSK
ncbi:hypothetical protein AVEN_72186-1 [Araneus ventricosus]|uniref:Uncharacterized protein n=1 Tax=Araneus ventricosus TaxID=182803 RepID=A0A4Y2EL17_ARAVE|nr:hypothetical protein AVEN_72186-1 [Araneus ventricosus]